MTEPEVTVRPYVARHWRARVAVFMLGLFALVSFLLLGMLLVFLPIWDSAVSVTDLVQNIPRDEKIGEAEIIIIEAFLVTISRLSDVSLWIVLPTFLTALVIGQVAALIFIQWSTCTHQNLPALGARNLKFSSREALWSWFIPLVHFYRPYQVMREVWRASDPGVPGHAIAPTGSSSALVDWWWGLSATVLATGYAYALWVMAVAGGTSVTVADHIILFFIFFAVILALATGAGILGILMILGINGNQTKKHTLITAGEPPAATPGQGPMDEAP